MSQEDLALAIHEAGERVSIQTLRLVEQGKRDKLRPDTAVGLVRGLRWPDDALERIRGGEDWEQIETVEASDLASTVAKLTHRVGELEATVVQLRQGASGPLTSDEQDIMALPWPLEKKLHIIAQMRGEGGAAAAAR